MKKLNAFTLIEMLVVLILTGLVVSLSYSAYEIFLSYRISYLKSSRHLSQLEMLHLVLEKDFSQASSIKEQSGSIRFENPDASLFLYHFNESNIVREQEFRADTFYLFNEGVAEIQTVPNTGLITKLSINLSTENKPLSFIFTKEYGPALFTKQEDEH